MAPRPLTIYFALGLLLSVFLAAHGYAVEGDQVNLLRVGWLLASEGTLSPVGNPATGGGYVPGALTSLLIGVPLAIWPDNRAPSFLLVLLHLVAYLLLDRVARETLSERGRLLFCVLYWLNPWRLFYSAFVWNPNYLVVFAALQLYSGYRLRANSDFWQSLLHVAAVGLAFQIDLSCFILLVASVLLYARGYIKVSWPGAVCGALVVLLPLIPWFPVALRDPGILPLSGGFIGQGFVFVYPLLRGIGYWLRFPSLALTPTMLVIPADRRH